MKIFSKSFFIAHFIMIVLIISFNILDRSLLRFKSTLVGIFIIELIYLYKLILKERM